MRMRLALGVLMALIFCAPTNLPAQESGGVNAEKRVPPRFKMFAWGNYDYRVAEDVGSDVPSRGFSVPFLRLVAKGHVSDRVQYVASLQGDFLDSAKPIDVFADLNLAPWLKLRTGQFKYAFDLAATTNGHARPLTDLAFITNAVAGSMAGKGIANSPVGSFRDRGASLLGVGRAGDWKIRWALGAFQGNSRSAENNSTLGFTANLKLEPIKDLTLNSSYMTTDTANDSVSTTKDYEALTLGAVIKHNQLFARAEYLRGERSEGAVQQVVSGFYVLLGFRVSDNIDLLARYHEMKDEKFAPTSDSARGYDFGVRYFLQRMGRWSGTSIDLAYYGRDADVGFQGMKALNIPKSTPISAKDAGGVVALTIRIRG